MKICDACKSILHLSPYVLYFVTFSTDTFIKIWTGSKYKHAPKKTIQKPFIVKTPKATQIQIAANVKVLNIQISRKFDAKHVN